MSDDVVIRVEGLWKRYGLGLVSRLKRRVNALRSGRALADDADHWALRDINLEVKRGETLGIIGRNGAGKSTLLKILAGVTPPTRGKVEVHGRVFPMIELNAGLHMDLAGRENVFLLGAIMGLTRSEIRRLLPAIEEFCELGEFFNQPVRTYSSGMLARLGFAVAVNVEADILLIDEVLAVGDLQFQNKCLKRFKDIRESGNTILFVSHNLDLLQYLTRRSIVLEEGALIGAGEPMAMVNLYEGHIFRKATSTQVERRFRHRQTTEDVIFEHVAVLDAQGQPVTQVKRGDLFGIEMVIRSNRPVTHPSFQLAILNAAGVVCVWRLSEEDGLRLDTLDGRYVIRVWFQNANLANGRYEFAFALRNADSYETLERFYGLTSFAIVGPGRARGIMHCNCRWECKPAEQEITPHL